MTGTQEALVSTEHSAIWFDARLVSLRPLVTLSSLADDFTGIAELAYALPEIFDTQCGLHIVSNTWTIDKARATSIAEQVARVERILPGHHFLVLASDEEEQFHLTKAGLWTAIGNGSIFIDEKICRIFPPQIPGLGSFDAVYNARLMAYKRHELATAIPRLLLLHGHSFGDEGQRQREHVEKILPNAVSANHHLSPRKYQQVPTTIVPQVLAHAKCGLAFSKIEGVMKASVEYMLCGLPVVSTQSVGARARYYCFPFTSICEDNPEAVAVAVLEVAACQYDRTSIRMEIARVLAFDRHNFLLAVNDCNKKVTGHDRLFGTIAPFLGFKRGLRLAENVLQDLNAQAASLKETV